MERRRNIRFNENTKNALAELESNEELRKKYEELLTQARLAIMYQLDRATLRYGQMIHAKLENEDSFEIYANVVSMQLAHMMEKAARANTETFAGMALADGFTKATLSKIFGITQPSLTSRYPHLEELADAQDRADETGQTQTVDMGDGLMRDVEKVEYGD